jgi:hypothetical protein
MSKLILSKKGVSSYKYQTLLNSILVCSQVNEINIGSTAIYIKNVYFFLIL